MKKLLTVVLTIVSILSANSQSVNKLKKELLKPTKIYVNEILKLCKKNLLTILNY